MIKRHWLKVFTGLYLLLNALFVGLELYKDQIREQWIHQQTIPEVIFLELNQFNSWTLAIESTLSIAIILIGLWLIMVKSKSINKFIISTIIASTIVYIIGIVIGIFVPITGLNLVQQLIGPIVILLCLSIYVLVKNGFKKYGTSKRSVEI